MQNLLINGINNATNGTGNISGHNGSGIPPQGINPAPNGLDVMGISTILAIIVGIANICLLIALIYVYLKSYKRIKSKFTTGLLVFASLLLIQNLFSTAILAIGMITGPGHHDFEIGRQEFPLSSINVIQLIALSILLYITWE